MDIKVLVAALVIVGASTVGCGATSDDEALGEEEGSTSAVESALSPRDDQPVPFDRPFPTLGTKPPIWDLQHYIEDAQRPTDFGNCYRYYVRLQYPARGTEVPIVVCR
jgi:hypothetical protein